MPSKIALSSFSQERSCTWHECRDERVKSQVKLFTAAPQLPSGEPDGDANAGPDEASAAAPGPELAAPNGSLPAQAENVEPLAPLASQLSSSLAQMSDTERQRVAGVLELVRRSILSGGGGPVDVASLSSLDSS